MTLVESKEAVKYYISVFCQIVPPPQCVNTDITDRHSQTPLFANGILEIEGNLRELFMASFVFSNILFISIRKTL